jgi:hypothetical protein
MSPGYGSEEPTMALAIWRGCAPASSRTLLAEILCTPYYAPANRCKPEKRKGDDQGQATHRIRDLLGAGHLPGDG